MIDAAAQHNLNAVDGFCMFGFKTPDVEAARKTGNMQTVKIVADFGNVYESEYDLLDFHAACAVIIKQKNKKGRELRELPTTARRAAQFL